MDAIQKSLDAVQKKAPGLHSTSSSAKASLTNPTVHDSIDRLIQQIESAKAAIHAGSSDSISSSSTGAADPSVVVAELKHAVETTQKNILERQKEFYAAISKSTKALDKKFPTPIDGVADPSLFTSSEAQAALEKVILKHLQRNGDWSTSQIFANEAGLRVSRRTEDLFAQLHDITTSMTEGNLGPAIAWAESQRPFLAARKSNLEFALHRSQFIRIAAGMILPGSKDASLADPDGENIEMISASIDQLPPCSDDMTLATTAADGTHHDHMDGASMARTNISRAMEYGRRYLSPFRESHLSEISRLFTMLIYLPTFLPLPSYGPEGWDSIPMERLSPSVPPIYQPLLDSNLVHAPFLEPLFRLEFCARNRLAKEAPLSIGVEIGAGGALSRIIKVRAVMKERGNEWSQADELPIEIPLPNRLRFHSIFACPVSKEQGTEENPPMMLACGHVLCLDTLNRLAKGNGRFKCPYCPTESYVSQAIRVYF